LLVFVLLARRRLIARVDTGPLPLDPPA
jgi:hypothetical protein